jgi:hypothetical protein
MKTVTQKRKAYSIQKQNKRVLKEKKLESKIMHGQYIRSINRQLIGEDDTYFWLARGDLKTECENEITTTQGQILQTKHYVTKIFRTETDSKFRLW